MLSRVFTKLELVPVLSSPWEIDGLQLVISSSAGVLLWREHCARRDEGRKGTVGDKRPQVARGTPWG